MKPEPIFEDDLLILRQADFCALPGYLILRLKVEANSLAELSDEQAGRVGRLLARAGAALQQHAAADRVYLLSFCELDRRLHFHLVPRSHWLAAQYRRETGNADEGINGALLWDWLRERYPVSDDLPAPAPASHEVDAELRRQLNG